METAGEGGPWGMAVLAKYMVDQQNETLEQFLDARVFAGAEAVEVKPVEESVNGFNEYLEAFKAGLEAEKVAITC